MQTMTITRDMPASGDRLVDVSQVIDGARFNGFSARVAAVCFLAIVFDGLDVSLFGTLLPAIMKDMQMGPAEAGALASIGHVGAVGGAVLFGMAADAWGRKRMMLVGMAVFIVCTAACGLARGFTDFAIYRFLAGVGLAGIVPIAVALVYEYTPSNRKAMASSLSYMGITVGVLLSAVLAMALLPTVGWRGILVGTFACILLVPVALWWLPESMSTLLRQGRRAQIGRILAQANPAFVPQRDDRYALAELPPARVPLAHLFQGGHARNTLLLGTALLCLMMIAVTLTTWIAQLMVQRGHSLATGITFILVFASSNLVSTPLAGWLSDRWGYKRVVALYMPVLCVAIGLLGVVVHPWAALCCMFLAGFAAMGATCLLLPYAGSLYPMAVRSTAMGVIYGIGRAGPIVGPAVAGAMLAAGVSVQWIFVCIAAPSLLAWAAFQCTRDLRMLPVPRPPVSSTAAPKPVPTPGLVDNL